MADFKLLRCIPAGTRLFGLQRAWARVCLTTVWKRKSPSSAAGPGPGWGPRRLVSTGGRAKRELVETKGSPYAGLTAGGKVKEAGKDAAYLVVIVVGVGITGLMFYAIGRELFNRHSPSGIFSEAFAICKNDQRIQAVLGEPIKAYGEETRRRRRRHVSHVEYEADGVKYLRMKFYIEGQYRKGSVNLEVKKEFGKYNYRYLFVELEGYPHQVIILEDNR